ncbi:MAG: helix-turn-helix transcriptional regulator [Pseudomonadota bacterium]
MRATRQRTDDEIIIGKNLRRIRKAHQLTQSDLAKRLFITFQQVQKYERGKNRISCGRLIEMARILDTRILDFFEHIDMPGVAYPKTRTRDMSVQELRDGIYRDLKCISDLPTLCSIKDVIDKFGMSQAPSKKYNDIGWGDDVE